MDFIETCNFKDENGHSVASFGVPYSYTGSKSSENVPPIPEALKPIFEKVNQLQGEIISSDCPDERNRPSTPVANACLINKDV